MGTASKIFMLLMPLVLLFVILAIFFSGEEGLFAKVKGAVLGAKDVVKEYLPKFSTGLQEQKAEVTIPDEHRAQVMKLQEAITSMLMSREEQDCFANYGGFSDLGEAGTSLVFDFKDGKTFLTVFAGAGGKNIIPELSGEIPGMKPCVIAGKNGVGEHFFKHFVDGENLIHPYFSEVNALKISYDTDGANENALAVAALGLENDLNDNGWLFTPDGEHICFFPTNDVSDYGDEGIEEGYFTDGKENSIQNKIERGELRYCSS